MLCTPCFHAVLGRFVHALCEFCEERYGMSHKVSDFRSYEFAKVGPSTGVSLPNTLHVPAMTQLLVVALCSRILPTG